MWWILKLLGSNCCILDLSWICLSFLDIGLLDKDLSGIHRFRFVRNSLDLLETSRTHVLKRSWRCLEHNDFLSSKMSWRHLLRHDFKTPSKKRHFLKPSSSPFGDQQMLGSVSNWKKLRSKKYPRRSAH